MKGFWRLFDRLLDLMAALAGVILVFITAAVCYSIGMRYLFTRGSIWLTQTTEYALLWIVFLATAWLLREGGHITTDIVYVHLGRTAKGYLSSFMCLVGALASAAMLVLGVYYTESAIARHVMDVRAVSVPKWMIFIVIPAGSLLLTIQFLRMAWHRFSQTRAGATGAGRVGA